MSVPHLLFLESSLAEPKIMANSCLDLELPRVGNPIHRIAMILILKKG